MRSDQIGRKCMRWKCRRRIGMLFFVLFPVVLLVLLFNLRLVDGEFLIQGVGMGADKVEKESVIVLEGIAICAPGLRDGYIEYISRAV
jgi:hypothetical protein